jgi:dipeptidyl aminopeptidase/acylaminoacyl peptidase
MTKASPNAHGWRLLAALALLAPVGALSAQNEPLSPIDVARLRTVTTVAVSPDGEWIAFARTEPRLADEGRGPDHRHLLVVRKDGGVPEVVVGGARRVGQFAWSPDSVWLTMTASGEGHDHPEVYGFATEEIAEGTAVKPMRLTYTPNGVGSFRWRPGSGGFAYTSLSESGEAARRREEFGFDRVVVDEEWRDLELWYAPVEGTGEVLRLTAEGTVFDFVWSPRGDRLAAAIAPRNTIDDRYVFQRLHLIDLEGNVRKIVDNPGKLGQFAFSPDGTMLAWVGAADVRDPHAGSLWVYGVDAEGASPRLVTDGFRGDVHHVVWTGNLRILAAVSRGVRSELRAFDLEHGDEWSVFSKEGLAFTDFDLGGETIAMAASTPERPAEVYVLEGEVGERSARALTDSNAWLADRELGRQEVVRFASEGDVEIEGMLIHPAAGTTEPGQPTPLVIVVHGGPEAHYSNGWLTRYSEPGQVLAGHGFRVWYPNYRSSTGYGVDFAKHDHGDLMGGEFADHLWAIRVFAERGLVDRERVGILGGSYGGYTAAWAATKESAHFAAAVSFVPFTDIRTKWLTSDIPNEFRLVHYEEKWPHEQAAYLAERSPLTYASECRTPLLLVGGDADTRVHPSQPFMLYRAIRFSRPDARVRYVQYPGEGHGNRINTNRFDYTVRALRWFDHYLGEGGDRARPLPPIDLGLDDWTGTANR